MTVEKPQNLGRAEQHRRAWIAFMTFVDRHVSSNWLFRGVAWAQEH